MRYELKVFEMKIEKFKELFDNDIYTKGIEKVLLIKPFNEIMFYIYVKYINDEEYFEFAKREFEESKIRRLIKWKQ